MIKNIYEIHLKIYVKTIIQNLHFKFNFLINLTA